MNNSQSSYLNRYELKATLFEIHGVEWKLKIKMVDMGFICEKCSDGWCRTDVLILDPRSSNVM